jgi:choline dehydrogenase
VLFQSQKPEKEAIMSQSFDFIVVGSGAGGGVLASRLARNNKNLKVLLIEAGRDPSTNTHYQVPGFHALASEDPKLRWDYFVEHFTNSEIASRDPKRSDRGIFYPRASAIGGCTAHHAMITVYPDPSDWDNIARITGDPSWANDAMWRYFERATDQHGFGWLTIEAAGVATAVNAALDTAVDKIVLAPVTHLAENKPELAKDLWGAAVSSIDELFHAAPQTVFGDTNHLRQIMRDREGLYRIPLSTKNGRRNGVTEFILATNLHPKYHDNLTIWSDALVTRLICENDRFSGVEFLKQERAYGADRDVVRGDGKSWEDTRREVLTAFASKEIIVAAGAFNTPQLLMNSGIGPAQHLREFGIPTIVDRQGVGGNLQDRYEIGVIDQLDHEFSLLDGYAFDAGPDDKGFYTWTHGRSGFYSTNGGTIAIMRRSDPAATGDCDLFIFGVPSEFAGYKLGYSERVRAHEGRSRFTWVILKAHTNNTGEVRLRTNDPRDPPRINFKNFKDGQNPNDPDLDALERGVEYVRDFMLPVRQNGTTTGEFLPGVGTSGQILRGQELRDFIMTQAWGHHASCTCPIGREDDPNAVLDSEFRLLGAPGANLRVVDASIFPKIPGYFIVLPIYLVAEKAADVILGSYGATTMPD